MSSLPLVSVVVTTKNEESNIANCLQSIRNQKYPQEKIELIVVDNYSPDETVELAKKFTDQVYSKGPQRAAQLNFGVQKAKGKYVLYPDADMILSDNVLAECVDKCERLCYDALYIPEKIVGQGFWIGVRDFERSFYNGTCIDAVRFVEKDAFLEIGGFDENIDFGADDWDFNKRIKVSGEIGLIVAPLYHNEGNRSNVVSEEKSRYSKKFNKYIKKWGTDDPELKKQFGMRYRLFDVFVENGKWRKLQMHPAKTSGFIFFEVNGRVILFGF